MRLGKERSLAARLSVLAVALVAVVAVGAYWWTSRTPDLPPAGSAAYEQTARRFFRGLAGLQVGLIDAAKQEFIEATALAPGEPAVWANLGLAHLRLGEFDAAAPAIERAASLAPDSGDLAFLQGRLETSRGRRDAGILHLRRAVELSPQGLHARTTLIQEIENAGGPDADSEAQRVLETLVALAPENSAVLVERARLAAKRSDAPVLRDSVTRLSAFASGWPADVAEEFRAVQAASAASDFASASRSMAFLRNLLARVPTFLAERRLVTPSAELIADPFDRFIRLPNPSALPAEPDHALSYTAPPSAGTVRAAAQDWRAVVASSLDGVEAPVVFAADALGLHRIDVAGSVAPLSEGAPVDFPAASALLALDWNHDFRIDLVAAGARGIRLFLQSPTGRFIDATASTSRADPLPAFDATGVWAADVEMDGDLDIVVAVRNAAPFVLRNNGDQTWVSVQAFPDVIGVSAFVWADLDADGDPDAAMIDRAGALHVLGNLQAGQFERLPTPAADGPLTALAVGDVDADGALDLVTLDAGGAVRRASFNGQGWTGAPLTQWGGAPGASAPRPRVILADLDNNGALDVLASGATGSAVWLADQTHALSPLATPSAVDVWSVVDFDGNGQLDLAAVSDGRPVRLHGQGTRGYHYHVVRPRAQSAAGDQRINSFGVGGEIEVRAGLLVQKQVIAGPVVHLGLGQRESIDVTRIVWPNGVPQAEFDPVVDRSIVAEQRLKGSCPWIFADDGTGLRFVTDFLWRSPLGLRINAQDTAGATQTEDWVKIRGDQLVARNGSYDLRISAELWETHFVDHVSLMVVDHPEGGEVFVDERFVPGAPPELRLHATGRVLPVVRAWDQSAWDVTESVTLRDGQYLSTFGRGQYQGVATDHFVEVDLGAPLPAGVPMWLVAQGWTYPTDSSINVAIGQGRHVTPRDLSLEAQDARGRWVSVATGLGFPAGKNKTALLDLSLVEKAGIVGARRLRLRTNLEIYWDFIGYAAAADQPAPRTEQLLPSRADLVYRGFSETRPARRSEPEVPVYERLANTSPRWRDLEGYYTRFGDVRELLATVEDRYVIMNAGDELRLTFPAPPPPPPGWTRDFVLVGDGWVKDGDFNTSFSKTVVPLPTHASATYTARSARPTLDEDPVYRRHAKDWQVFHTRFVTPRTFLAGLRAAGR